MNSTQLVLFTLASGRSGTSYLADFFAKNITQCYSTHEPYFTFGNPTLFGKPIAWNTQHNDQALLPVLERKCRFIASRKQPFYFESNHAFLKAFNRHVGTLLNNPGFIHLVRHPLRVAKSEYVRERMIRQLRVPFVDYTDDTGERLFRWALTGQEEVFRNYPPSFSRLQFYLLQWLEIEYRAMQLIRDNHWQDRVFFIDVDVDLKREAVLKDMIRFFDLPHRSILNMNLRRNPTPFIGPTILTEQDKQEFQTIARDLPERYKKMLQNKPYRDCSWFAEVSPLMKDGN
ncbi:hypothetical protein [Nitrosomonas ureae]|uniref:Sulfotransferase family protein n=1 Tax=Nitrosomonas ureae TaxID=44577 RepID=A0A1H2DN00_9PROT|nr:hypothetical protein [Nitrosomonas ureae]ALQ50704.1 hypothetical protein ATY38_05330 [Nitrosomonas ureae]SDT84166.1 hypothetical protein SAMN05216406_101156 [Nitrosomonas ureae]